MANTTTTTPQACITVSYGRVRGKAAQYPYFQPCRYVAHRRRDGVMVWTLDAVLATPRRSTRLATEDAMSYVTEDCPFVAGVRQWAKVATPAESATVNA